MKWVALIEEGRTQGLEGEGEPGGTEHPPDPAEDAVQVPLHLHQGPRVVQEALTHLLQADT